MLTTRPSIAFHYANLLNYSTRREKSSLIGWRQILTTSPLMHIRFLLVRAKKITQWKTGFTQFPQTFLTNPLELTYYYTMQNSCCDHSNVDSANQPSACEQALLFIWTLTWRMTSETWRILKIFFGVSSLTPATYPKIFDRRPRKGTDQWNRH